MCDRSIPETPGAVPRKLRVIVADDHPRVLEEIRALLDGEFDVIQAVTNGLDLVAAAERATPDAVVSDVSMPGLDGIEAARRILARGATAAFVALTMYNDPHLMSRAMDAGIRGFILKVDAGEELIAAVQAASRGETYVSRSIRLQ